MPWELSHRPGGTWIRTHAEKVTLCAENAYPEPSNATPTHIIWRNACILRQDACTVTFTAVSFTKTPQQKEPKSSIFIQWDIREQWHGWILEVSSNCIWSPCTFWCISYNQTYTDTRYPLMFTRLAKIKKSENTKHWMWVRSERDFHCLLVDYTMLQFFLENSFALFNTLEHTKGSNNST